MVDMHPPCPSLSAFLFMPFAFQMHPVLPHKKGNDHTVCTCTMQLSW